MVTQNPTPMQMAKRVVERLEAVGIPARVASRAPQMGAGRGAAFIDIAGRGQAGKEAIRIYPGEEGKVTFVAGSKRHRQAVITLKEPPRLVVRVFKAANMTEAHKVADADPKASDPAVWKSLKGYCYRREVLGSKRFLLVGFDEKHLFISQMRKKDKPRTVVEAHQMLMPAEVRGVPGVKRQGEFFLRPVSQKQMERVMMGVNRGTYDAISNGWLGGTDHRGVIVVTHNTKDEEYTTGCVVQARHKALVCKTWYQVYRNREDQETSAGVGWVD
jgi:hypothetical protein